MKKKVPLLLIVLMGVSMWGKSQTAQEAVLYRCLMQTEMVEINHMNPSGVPEVVILDNGVLPKGQSFSWFGNPVVFFSMNEINDKNIKAFVTFEVFNMLSAEKAEVLFSYKCNGECSSWHYNLEFTKLDNQWHISKNETTLIE